MKKIDTLIEELKKAFKVTDWDVFVAYTNQDGNADVDINNRYTRMNIQIHRGFFNESPEYQAQTLIHEFCHLFNVPLYNLLFEAVNGTSVTQLHADDILENTNMRAEKTITGLLVNDNLRKAYKEYIKPLRSVKRRPKSPSKRKKTKTGTR